MSDASKPPPKKEDEGGEAKPPDAAPLLKKPQPPVDNETMVLQAFKLDEKEAVQPATKRPKGADDRTMMHVASAPRPKVRYADETMRDLKPIEAPSPPSEPPKRVVDETMRALKPIEPMLPEPETPPKRVADETLLVSNAPNVFAKIADPTIAIAPLGVPKYEPTIGMEPTALPPIPESFLLFPLEESKFPAALPVIRPAVRFDPTVTSGLKIIPELLEPPSSAVRHDATRTSLLSAMLPIPPEPRGTVEAIAAALARKHPIARDSRPEDSARDAEKGLRTPAIEAREESPPESPVVELDAPSESQGLPEPTTKRRRVGDALPIDHQTKFAPFVLQWRLRPPKDAIVVVVKATARIVDGKPTELVTAESPSGDVFTDDDPLSSLAYPSDFAIFKPRADVALLADAHAPSRGGAVANVQLRCGEHQWRLAAVGDRHWEGAAPSAPTPFETIPLTWEYALGGPLSPDNPTGRGFRTGLRLPNLERPNELITGKRDTPRPVCFAPVSPKWGPRAAKVGKYDAKWLKDRWPFLPEDFDHAYFNAAPVEMQVPYFRGDEEFEITSVQPNGGVLRGRLPGVRPHVYAMKGLHAGGELLGLFMNLDTVIIDARTNRVTLVWRGLLEVKGRDALDLDGLYIEEGPTGATSSNLEAPLARYQALLAAKGRVPIDVPAELPANDADASASILENNSAVAIAKKARRPLPPSRGKRPQPARRRRPVVVVPPDAAAEWIAQGRALAGTDLSGADLRGLDLRGRDLTAAILLDAQLDGARFEGAKCVGLIACRASAVDSSWVGADLSNADVSDARMQRADFTDAIITRLLAHQLHAEHAKFARARGEHAALTAARLSDATFEDGAFAKADFSSAVVHGARFLRAKLADAKFYEALGNRSTFDDADLNDARFEGARMVGFFARRVAATGSVWDSSDVTDGTFEGAVVRDASFAKVLAVRTLFNKVDAQQASFRGAMLKQACFLKADLTKATFEQADLTGADLRGAILDQAETWEAIVDGVDLRHTSLTGSKLATGKKA